MKYIKLFEKYKTSRKTTKEEWNELLINYCKNGTLEQIKNAVENGADIVEDNINITRLTPGESKHQYKLSPVAYVAYRGELEMVKYLISQGAPINYDVVDWAYLSNSNGVKNLVMDEFLKHNPEKIKEVEMFMSPEQKEKYKNLFRSRKVGLFDFKTFEKYEEENWTIQTWTSKVVQLFQEMLGLSDVEFKKLSDPENISDKNNNYAAVSFGEIKYKSSKTNYWYIITHQSLYNYKIKISARSYAEGEVFKIFEKEGYVEIKHIKDIFNKYENSYFNEKSEIFINKLIVGKYKYTDVDTMHLFSNFEFTTQEIYSSFDKIPDMIKNYDVIKTLIAIDSYIKKHVWWIKTEIIKFNKELYDVTKKYCENNATEFIEKYEELKNILPKKLLNELDYLKRGERTGLWDMKKENSSTYYFLLNKMKEDIKMGVEKYMELYYNKTNKALNKAHIKAEDKAQYYNIPKEILDEYCLLFTLYSTNVGKQETLNQWWVKYFPTEISSKEFFYSQIREKIKKNILESLKKKMENPKVYIDINDIVNKYTDKPNAYKGMTTPEIWTLKFLRKAVKIKPDYIKRSDRTGLWDMKKESVTDKIFNRNNPYFPAFKKAREFINSMKYPHKKYKWIAKNDDIIRKYHDYNKRIFKYFKEIDSEKIYEIISNLLYDEVDIVFILKLLMEKELFKIIHHELRGSIEIEKCNSAKLLIIFSYYIKDVVNNICFDIIDSLIEKKPILIKEIIKFKKLNELEYGYYNAKDLIDKLLDKHKNLVRSNRTGLWDMKKENKNDKQLLWNFKLLDSARKKDIEGIKLALKNGANINHYDANGDTALIISVMKASYENVKYLVDHGANIFHKNVFLQDAMDYSDYSDIYDLKSHKIIEYLIEYIIKNHPEKVKFIKDEYISDKIKKKYPDILRSSKSGLWDMKKENKKIWTFDKYIDWDSPAPRLEIKKWLKKHGITKFYIEDDLTVDTYEPVYISNSNIENLPFKFKSIFAPPSDGDFKINNNPLTSLKNSPDNCFMFDCSNCNLKSMKYAPENFNQIYYTNNPCSDDINQLKYFKIEKLLEDRINNIYLNHAYQCRFLQSELDDFWESQLKDNLEYIKLLKINTDKYTFDYSEQSNHISQKLYNKYRWYTRGKNVGLFDIKR